MEKRFIKIRVEVMIMKGLMNTQMGAVMILSLIHIYPDFILGRRGRSYDSGICDCGSDGNHIPYELVGLQQE